MSEQTPSTPHLAFSDKYDREHAEAYLRKHQDGLARRLSHWRDEQVARRALAMADEPTLVLDLPCGAGRFWPLLLAHPNRRLIAADNSPHMLVTAQAHQPQALLPRISLLQTSAFAIDLPDGAVDSIFCMRLLHHIGNSAHRCAILREFHRVTRDTVLLSLWVDGNYMAWRRGRLEQARARRQRRGEQNRFILPAAQVETEFRQAGFEILGHIDFLPLYSMWRTYVLRKAEPRGTR